MNVEYKVIKKDQAGLQQVLNQWRHDYRIKIESIQFLDNGEVGAVVKLFKKGELQLSKEYEE